LEQKNQENKGLIEEKAFVSQLQDQHSIELAKHKTKLYDACKHYQNTLKEEQSKLQLVTEELEMSKSDIVQLKADANKNEKLRSELDTTIETLRTNIATMQEENSKKALEFENRIRTMEDDQKEALARSKSKLSSAQVKLDDARKDNHQSGLKFLEHIGDLQKELSHVRDQLSVSNEKSITLNTDLADTKRQNATMMTELHQNLPPLQLTEQAVVGELCSRLEQFPRLKQAVLQHLRGQ
jgi:chromosome segregation ATPase